MKMDKIKPIDIATWVLVASALLTTGLVVRRELAPDPAAGQTPLEATYVDGWEEALAAGIRSGPANAPIQVIEFADFQCPHCARFESTIEAVTGKYPDQFAFTFAHSPMPYHEHAISAARVAECANDQNRFDTMRSLLFENQSTMGSVSWGELAEQAAIPDRELFDECVNDPTTLARVNQSRTLADKLGVRGTPTIIVNGWRLPLPPSPGDFDKFLENVEEGKPPSEDMIW